MKQQYSNNQFAGQNQVYQSSSVRHQHQLDLFENLEKELKSIIDLFTAERNQKRQDLEVLKSRVSELEYNLLR
jgi:hypothetical protein